MGLLSFLGARRPVDPNDPTAVSKPGALTFLFRGPVGYDQQLQAYQQYAQQQQDESDYGGLFSAMKDAADPAAQRQAEIDYISKHPRMAQAGINLLTPSKPTEVDGHLVQQQSDGSYKSIYDAPGSGFPKPTFGWMYNDPSDPTKGISSLQGGPGDPKVIKQNAEARHITVNVGAGFTDDDVAPYANAVAMGAPLPTGMSRINGMAARVYQMASRIRQKSGLSPETYAQVQAAYTGNKQAIGKLSAQRSSIAVAERTALANLQLARQISATVPRTSVPLVNKWLLAGRVDLAGDPNAVKLYNAVQTAREEYAKVLSGNTSSTGITDASRREAERLIRPDMTPDQIDAAIQTAQIEMGNRMDSFDNVLSDLGGAIGRGGFVTDQPVDEPHDPHTVQQPSAQSQKVRVWNPKTGRLE